MLLCVAAGAEGAPRGPERRALVTWLGGWVRGGGPPAPRPSAPGGADSSRVRAGNDALARRCVALGARNRRRLTL